MEHGHELASDEDLLRAARVDPTAFGAFYRRHETAIVRYFLARAGDAEVAADLTAETFAAALAGAHRYRARKGEPAAWLFGIARNVLAISRRAGRVESRARRTLGLPPLELSDDVIERLEALAAQPLELMDVLPAAQRDAVRARIVEERDYGDIAKDLRCSEAVVRKRVSRGLAAMRERLERDDADS